MNLKDCYTELGGDFDAVIGRLLRKQMVSKFLFKFLDDKSFVLFEKSMDNKNYDEALRAVHTLKGICQNLSFTTLFESSNQITIALKNNDYQTAIDLAPLLSKDYYKTVHAIEEYKKSMEV